jgi:hypothetical protein
MNHTKTPWRVGKSMPHASMATVISDSDNAINIGGATGPEAIEYYGGNMIAESVSPDNAAFIVRAVNFYTAPIRFWCWLKTLDW